MRPIAQNVKGVFEYPGGSNDMELVPDSETPRNRRRRRRRARSSEKAFYGPRFRGDRTGEMPSPKRRGTVIAFALALFIHAGIFCCAGGFYSEAQIGFKPGNSGITLMLNPSVASPEIVTRAEPTPDAPAQDPHPQDFEEIEGPEPPEPPQLPELPTERKGEPPHKEQPSKNLVGKEATPAPKEKPATTPPKEKQVALLPRRQLPHPQDAVPPVAESGSEMPNADIPMDHSRLEKERDSVEDDLKKQWPDKKSAPEGAPTKPSKVPGPKNDAKGNPRPSKYSPEIEGDMREKGVTSNATVTGLERPTYPSTCRRMGHEGDSIYEFTILPNGRCTDIILVQSAGCPDLDDAAKETLLRATFVPARRFGAPVSSRKKLLFRFRLVDAE